MNLSKGLYPFDLDLGILLTSAFFWIWPWTYTSWGYGPTFYFWVLCWVWPCDLTFGFPGSCRLGFSWNWIKFSISFWGCQVDFQFQFHFEGCQSEIRFQFHFVWCKNDFLFLVHFDGNSWKWLTGFFLERRYYYTISSSMESNRYNGKNNANQKEAKMALFRIFKGKKLIAIFPNS